MASYLTASDARTLAASLMALPGFAALRALEDAVLGGVLLTASGDVDGAMRYQGRKYDLTQANEFPRLAYGQPINVFGVMLPSPVPLTPDCEIWDWDFANSAAIAPHDVLLAVLYPAAWLMQPQYAARIEAIKSGLYQESIGTASETYADRNGPFISNGLGTRAEQLMNKYRIRSGRIL